MSKRHRDALYIWAGAVNPSGICHAIIAAQSEMMRQGKGTLAVTTDPAVRLMVAQLAYICEVWDGVSPFRYEPSAEVCSETCRTAVEADDAGAVA